MAVTLIKMRQVFFFPASRLFLKCYFKKLNRCLFPFLPSHSFSLFVQKPVLHKSPPPPAHTHTCPNLSARVQEGWPRSDVCRCVLVPETLANIDEEKKERKTDFNVAPQQGHLGISMASFYAPSHARLSRCPCDVEPVTWSPRRMHAPIRFIRLTFPVVSTMSLERPSKTRIF